MKSKMVSTTAGLFALLKIIAIMIIGLLTTTATTTATTTTTVTCVLGGGGMGLSMPSMSFNGFVSTSRSRRRRIAKLLWSQKSDVVYRHPHKYNKIHAIQTRGGAAAAAAADDGETIINKKKRVRVALIGSGRMGHIRASILQSNPRFDFVGVVDVDVDRATALAEMYGVKAYSSLEEILTEDTTTTATTTTSSNSLDAIVISTPTSTHESLIWQAAKHQISVFTETPVGETAEQIETLFRIASKAQIHLCCGFQRRFDPSYVSAAQAIAKGKIGKPVVANLFFADHPAPPKEFMLEGGGDIFLDLCAHDVDYITDALQDEVVSVYATAMTSRHDPDLIRAGIHDNAIMVLHFRRGTVATLFMSRSATYGYDQRCEVFGNQGLVSVLNQPETTTVLADNHGIQHSKLKHSFPQRFEQAFALELDAFANTVLAGEPWPITGEQCVKVQRVADAARKSSSEGCVVTISV